MRAARRPRERGASSPAAPDELDRGGQAVLCRAAGQRERGPAEAVERIREADAAAAGARARRRRRAARRTATVGVDEQVEPVEELVAALAVLIPQPAARSTSPSVTSSSARASSGRLAVLVRVLREEAAVDVGDLAHEERVLGPVGKREVERRGCAESARRPPRHARGRADRPRRARRRRRAARRATRARAGSNPGTSARSSSTQPSTVDGHRPDVVVARGEREAAVGRDEAVRRLEADDAAPRRRDPDRAAGVGAERELDVARGDRRRRAAARAAGEAARVARVRDRAEVRVLRRDRRTRTRAGSSCRRRRSPRASRRSTASARARGTWSAKRIEPYVVTRPAVSSRSLTATGVPAADAPDARARSVTGATLLAGASWLLRRCGDARPAASTGAPVVGAESSTSGVSVSTSAADASGGASAAAFFGSVKRTSLAPARIGDLAEVDRAELAAHRALAARLDDQRAAASASAESLRISGPKSVERRRDVGGADRRRPAC